MLLYLYKKKERRKTMMYEKLNSVEKTTILDYIIKYNECKSENVNLEKVLSHWEHAKSKCLKDIFQDNLILSKKIKFEKNPTQLRNDLDDDVTFREGIAAVKRALFTSEKNNVDTLPFMYLEDAIGFWNFANNKIQYNIDYTMANGKRIKFQKGTKPVKVLKKICENIDVHPNLFEEIRIAHSMVLNQKIFKGEICLSIHPLDYMTMSDNNCDWHSCMSWKYEGSYRSGTIEMMNSPYIIVAYIKSSTNMLTPGNHTWNSKKWRSLVLIHPDYLATTIRTYPFHNQQINKMVIEWVQELLVASGHSEYKEAKMYNSYKEEDNDLLFESFSFESNRMYNDFGLDDHCFILNPNANIVRDVKNRIVINYSGPCTCMLCGEHIKTSYTEDLCCHNCSEENKCDNCNSYYHKEDIIVLSDGTKVCHHCYKQFCKFNFFSENKNLSKNFITIWLAQSEESAKMSMCNYSININSKTEIDEELWMEKFGTKIVNFSTHTYGIILDKITKNKDLFFKLFEMQNNTRLKNFDELIAKAKFEVKPLKIVYDYWDDMNNRLVNIDGSTTIFYTHSTTMSDLDEELPF